jgi:co-chaperonin GroES (HSP10)
MIVNLKPTGDNILIHKCGVGQSLSNGDRGIAKEDGTPLLILPQYYADTTSFVEIVDVGPDCEMFHVEHCQKENGDFGETTLCPEMGDGMHHIEEHYWIIKESLLFPVIFPAELDIQAIGDCVVVEVPAKDQSKLIVTCDQFQDKTYVYPVVSVGNGVKDRILKGSQIIVQAKIKIFKIKDKQYGCVREEDVLGVAENET